jgi:putative redox protein
VSTRSVAATVHTPLDEETAALLLASAERVCYVTNTLRRPPELVVSHRRTPGAG